MLSEPVGPTEIVPLEVKPEFESASVPEATSIVPVSLTGKPTVAVPDAAVISSVPALVKEVPV